MNTGARPIEFKVDDLLEAARKVIDAKAEAAKEYEAKCEAHYAEHRVLWIERNAANIRALRDYLTKCLRTGRVPVAKDLDKLANSGARYRHGFDERFLYEKPSMISISPGRAYYTDTEDLEGLVAMLEGMQGEVVSASQLRTLGFKSRSIIDLFRDIAASKRAEAAKEAVA
jgi:hypothetical protein